MRFTYKPLLVMELIIWQTTRKGKMFKLLLYFTSTFLVCQGSIFSNAKSAKKLNSYYVYTRENSRDPFQLTEENISSSPIVLNRMTVIVIHGHGGSAFTTVNPLVKDALLVNEDVNVIVVDWSKFARLSYSKAVATVPNVGLDIGELIKVLIDESKLSLDQLHIVGFDLGAHIASYATRYQAGIVARITGLDPSASQWENNPHRLSITDARYVEVIHTDVNGVHSNAIGRPIGHVDFFPNGGSDQPGCLLNSCNHMRAYELFAASLTHGGLIGYKCNTKVQLSMDLCYGYTLEMGTNTLDKIGSGIFRINTNRIYPF